MRTYIHICKRTCRNVGLCHFEASKWIDQGTISPSSRIPWPLKRPGARRYVLESACHRSWMVSRWSCKRIDMAGGTVDVYGCLWCLWMFINILIASCLVARCWKSTTGRVVFGIWTVRYGVEHRLKTANVIDFRLQNKADEPVGLLHSFYVCERLG